MILLIDRIFCYLAEIISANKFLNKFLGFSIYKITSSGNKGCFTFFPYTNGLYFVFLPNCPVQCCTEVARADILISLLTFGEKALSLSPVRVIVTESFSKMSFIRLQKLHSVPFLLRPVC